MASLKEKGIIALDKMTPFESLRLAERLAGKAVGVKFEDLMFGSISTPQLLCEVKAMRFKIAFADAKDHRTPEATYDAVKRLAYAGADVITVHGLGGKKMVAKAVAAYRDAGVRDARRDAPGLGIACNAALTSLTKTECRFIYGIYETHGDPTLALASRAAHIAREGGAFGIVCSPGEVQHVKKDFPFFTFFAPGIRPAGWPKGRHARFATPAMALESGADYLIIGEPITKAPDPLEAIAKIDETIEHLPE